MKNLYLSNLMCGDVYPDNRPGEFTNYLNQPLKGSWSVALNEMYYVPDTWHNIRYPGNVIQLKISSMIHKEVVGIECGINPQGRYKCRRGTETMELKSKQSQARLALKERFQWGI